MSHLLIRHKVADFAKWKASYDHHAGVRKAAGLTESNLLRSAENPNEVFILFTVSDVNKAKALTGSADLRAEMQKAGVVDKPDVYFLS
jgi:hypothetical protein